MGARYEHIDNDPGQTGVGFADSYGINVHHRVATDLEIRSEYIGYNMAGSNATSWYDSRFNVGAVVLF
jgi:hypothetical protein